MVNELGNCDDETAKSDDGKATMMFNYWWARLANLCNAREDLPSIFPCLIIIKCKNCKNCFQL